MAETTDYVTREAMLFEAGSYPDRQIDVTEDDLDRICAGTEQAPIQVGHKEPGFTLGFVRDLVRKGKELWGTLHLHPEANALVERNGIRSLSVAMPRTKERLTEVSVTGTPHVAGAAMFSGETIMFSVGEKPEEVAFAVRHSTPHGQAAMQELHDTSARHGAVCDPDKAAEFASAHESGAIQRIHDMSVSHGAKCEKMSKETSDMPVRMFSKETPPQAHFTRAMKGHTMKALFQSLIDKLRGVNALDETEVAEFSKQIAEMPEPQAPPDHSAEFAKMQDEINTLRADKLKTQAEAWADAEIEAGRAMTAERAGMIAAFSTAAQDDARDNTLLTFSEGETEVKASRVELLKRLYAARTPHVLFTEMVKEGKFDGAALFNQMETAREGAEKPFTDARRAELLEKAGPLGQVILRERTNGGGH